jgi:hypothetical protein
MIKRIICTTFLLGVVFSVSTTHAMGRNIAAFVGIAASLTASCYLTYRHFSAPASVPVVEETPSITVYPKEYEQLTTIRHYLRILGESISTEYIIKERFNAHKTLLQIVEERRAAFCAQLQQLNAIETRGIDKNWLQELFECFSKPIELEQKSADMTYGQVDDFVAEMTGYRKKPDLTQMMKRGLLLSLEYQIDAELRYLQSFTH